MKLNIIKVLAGLLIVLPLTSCDQMDAYRFLMMGNKRGEWGNDMIDVFGREDDDDDGWMDGYDGDGDNYSSQNGGNSRSSNNTSSSNGGNSGNNELTFDENSTNFGHSFSGTGAGEVAIQVFSDKCKDDDLIIPSTYVDAKGNKYQVTMDYGNGFSYLSAQKITLPDGFKEIHEGFDQSMYVKTIYLPKTITKLCNEILVSCVSLSKISFAGTKAEWNAITKEERWNAGAPAFDVSCKDGIINIEKGPSV